MIILLDKCETNFQSPTNWYEMEELIEVNSYIVAVLNYDMKYICTGTIISPVTVLTAGHCINKQPAHIVFGLCVIRSEIPYHNLVKVKSANTHHDFHYFKDFTEMHSNLGLLTVRRPVLTYYMQSARIGNYFASELKGRNLTVLGFGRTLENVTMLQKQTYRAIHCMLPKLFYCICGKEKPEEQKDMINFAEGAPVIFDRHIVGIVAATKSTFKTANRFRALDEDKNIFTVLAPYEIWLQQYTSPFKRTSVRSGCTSHTSFQSVFCMFFSILVLQFLLVLINCMPILY